jgi:cysteine-rich repeat protein
MSVCVASICGDNRITGAEGCDDGGTMSGNGCSATCTVEAGYECTGMPSVCTVSCGDSTLDPGEGCDDGGTMSGNGCSATCTVEAGYECVGAPSVCTLSCGDGGLDMGETCDDMNTAPGDGCSSTCAIEVGYICTGSPSVCAQSCGNGALDAGEMCDDMNTMSGDGCSSACLEEAGYTCTGAPSSCVTDCGDGIVAGAEQCDDGNTAAGDCCSATCTPEAGCEIEPNDTLATANSYSTVFVSGEVKGFIDPTDDIDLFMMTVPAAQEGTITAATVDGFQGTTCASLALDSFITIYDSTGIPIAGNDDKSASDYCSSVTSATLAAGDYYVGVTKSPLAGATDTFDYTLQASVTTSAPADDCLAADCVAGATCVDLPGGFVCNCAAGTYGNGRMSGTGCVAGSGLYYAFDGTGAAVPNLATVPPAGAANATIVGTQTQGGMGKCGTGLVGSGGISSANYVNTGWATSLTGPWTVSFWIRNFTATAAALQYVFGDNTAQSFRCFGGGVAGDTNLIFRGTGMGDLLVPGAANGSLSMVTFVYDPAARNVKAYLNGTLINAVGQSTPLSFTGAGPFKVGGYSTANALPANAVLDDFRLYFRALSATDVTDIYNSATCSAVAP